MDQEIYAEIARDYGLSLKSAKGVARRVLAEVVEGAAGCGKSRIGKYYFKRIERKPKRYRNPRTGVLEMSKSAKYVVMKKKIA